jgi:hypothetical protein
MGRQTSPARGAKQVSPFLPSDLLLTLRLTKVVAALMALASASVLREERGGGEVAWT